MTYHHDRLQTLQEKVARKQKVIAMVEELQAQKCRLDKRARELDAVRIKEQTDVDKLEGGSLASFFYNVIGKMDERLDKEREEAYAAAVRYDTAAAELTTVEEDLNRYRHELRQLAGVEVEYLRVLQEKKDAIKADGSTAAQELSQLEEALQQCRIMEKELVEAISAGRKARSAAQHISSKLEDADSFATWDRWGGGLIADIGKHSALDEAQQGVNSLQSALRRFKTEMADVRLQADMQVNIEGFDRFADFFFDGWIVDWMIADRIHQSQQQMEDISAQIEHALGRLSAMERDVKEQGNSLQHRIDELVKNTLI